MKTCITTAVKTTCKLFAPRLMQWTIDPSTNTSTVVEFHLYIYLYAFITGFEEMKD